MTSSYTSIAVLLLSNIGYYANFFDAESCQRYFIAAPILKGMLLLPFLRAQRDWYYEGGVQTTLWNAECGRGSQEGRAIDVVLIVSSQLCRQWSRKSSSASGQAVVSLAIRLTRLNFFDAGQ